MSTPTQTRLLVGPRKNKGIWHPIPHKKRNLALPLALVFVFSFFSADVAGAEGSSDPEKMTRCSGELWLAAIAASCGALAALSHSYANRSRSTEFNSAPTTKPLEVTSVSTTEALRHAKEAAEAANRAKDDFIASLSHELRSPLNPVLLLASEYARSPGLPPQMREDFQIILKNVRLQARLIDDLLDLTRIERGGISISARMLDLAVVLREVCESLRGEAEEKHLRIELDLPDGCCAVRGDSVRLQQVFGNIVRNAIKFSHSHSTIHVKLSPSASSARVSVSDQGFGIREANLKRIFEPFTQGPRCNAYAAAQGLGLGLSIAQRLVERHRGEITAESAGPGLGATFHVDLPLEARPPELPSVSICEPAYCATAPSIRILLVDDHETTRNVLARMVRKLGHEVLVAGDIRSASEILFETGVDVLVSDLGLPDGDGTELTIRWKPRIKFGAIALSGFGMESDVIRSRESGFAYHLTKPVEFERLAELIQRVCRAEGAGRFMLD